MNVPHRRRWYRVSLLSLFVWMTLFCVFLSWQLSIVRQRQTILNALRARGVVQVVPASASAGSPARPVAKVSPIRRLLGDEAVQEIWYSWFTPLSAEEQAQLQRLFPEAAIRESVPEPCHPGCFPAGTLVETQEGPRRIETLRPGDLIKAFGEPASLPAVQEVFVTDNRLWRVDTEGGRLITTETQPLVLSDRSVRQAGALRPGDELLRLSDGGLRAVKVIEVQPLGRTEKVYNVILGSSEIMLANGFLSRSKPPKTSRADVSSADQKTTER